MLKFSAAYKTICRHTKLQSALKLGLLFTPLFLNPAFAAEEPVTEAQLKAELPIEEVRTFVDIWDRIKKDYVEEIDDATLFENAIKGMLSELDPHSAYLGPKDFEDLQVNTTGEFGGLGIEVGMEDGFVKVISPIDDTPATKAGVQSGDLIVKLDKTPVKGLSLSEAVNLMRGKAGTPIVLTIIRDGESQPIEITVVRDIIQVKSVRSERLEDNYGYIRISQFQVHTGEDLAKHIKKLMNDKKQPPVKGILLDLRNNPGGVLQAAVEVVDQFIEDGLVVYTKGRIPNADIDFEATPGDLTNDLPIVVLVNSGSASASEIVAGALKDHKRGIIVGKTTFGKGSVQTVLPLAEDKALKLTTARYYTPAGTSIQAHGIKPDIEIDYAKVTRLENQNEYREADLSGHLMNENDTSEEKKNEEKKESLAEKDYQLYEALNILKAASFASTPKTTTPADKATKE